MCSDKGFLYVPENQAEEVFQSMAAIHGAGAGAGDGCPWKIKG